MARSGIIDAQDELDRTRQALNVSRACIIALVVVIALLLTSCASPRAPSERQMYRAIACKQAGTC